MINNEVLLRDETLYAQLRAYGVDPFFLYVSLSKQLPNHHAFPSIHELLEEVMDEMLAVNMKRAMVDASFVDDVLVRSDWAVSNGRINIKEFQREVTAFSIMDMLNELRLPHTIDSSKKIYGVIPQKEVW